MSEVASVVIIGDQELVAEALSLSLTHAGLRVLGRSPSLAGGLALVARSAPDVTLLDCWATEGGAGAGVEAVVRCRPSTAVIVLSPAADHRLAADALRAGAAGYVTKEAALSDLVEAVRAAASGRTAFPPEIIRQIMRRLRVPSLDPGATLTPREREALRQLGCGYGVDEVAARMGITRNTARKHVQAVLDKLSAHSQLQAVAIARREGLLVDA